MDLEIKILDFRLGGIFQKVLKAQNGPEMWGKFRYLELEEPHRITLINSFSNTESETVLVVPFGADWPLEMWTEYRFEAAGIQTLLYLTSHPLN